MFPLRFTCVLALFVALSGCGSSKAELMTVYQGEVKILEDLNRQVSEIEREKEKGLRDIEKEFMKTFEAEEQLAKKKLASAAKLREKNIVGENEGGLPVSLDKLTVVELKKLLASSDREIEEMDAAEAKTKVEVRKNWPIVEAKLRSATADFDQRIKNARDKVSAQEVKRDAAKKRLDAAK